MILRVRPAQLTTIVVSKSGATSCTLCTSSAPGMSIAVGIFITLNSSSGRESSTTNFWSLSIIFLSSFAEIDGVPYTCSTNSPNALLGTFKPLKTSKPAACHEGIPPSNTPISVYPNPANLVAALSTSPSPPSQSTMGVVLRGT